MKSTPDQTVKRRELRALVNELGILAWKQNPHVAPCAIVPHKDSVLNPGVIDYDEYFVFEKSIKAIPATATKGKVCLRFRRRVTQDRKNEALWHLWEPGYAATKPEAIDEILPIVRAVVDALRR